MCKSSEEEGALDLLNFEMRLATEVGAEHVPPGELESISHLGMCWADLGMRGNQGQERKWETRTSARGRGVTRRGLLEPFCSYTVLGFPWILSVQSLY
jgi:hypothetical protein